MDKRSLVGSKELAQLSTHTHSCTTAVMPREEGSWGGKGNWATLDYPDPPWSPHDASPEA